MAEYVSVAESASSDTTIGPAFSEGSAAAYPHVATAHAPCGVDSVQTGGVPTIDENSAVASDAPPATSVSP